MHNENLWTILEALKSYEGKFLLRTNGRDNRRCVSGNYYWKRKINVDSESEAR